MTSDLEALVVAADDPAGLASFWSGVLRRPLGVGTAVLPVTETEFPIRFVPTTAPKDVPNQMHFDLTSSSLEDQQETVDRALELGGSHLDIGQGPDAEHVVMADPEGNELCVIPPGNNFLAGTGTIGALSSDGSQAVGYFWSQALGWPLVWDQDEETAIQSPRGGSKISWGGPPVRQKTARNRLHLHLSPVGDDGVTAEVQRLVALGASRVDPALADPACLAEEWLPLLDPDGNELCVRA
ncbi:VOC family protein [Phycicoccus sp. Soil748]|uniref:VOC family protein n=1 Tax=Phycicoccus sp. Soil748 TaxID=1736397 RepID=UPI0007032048|nr:VOC family protein [Phycicoccus sp. Soil748]KRE54924.1 bleomycin resistance protein [Phycicoccus sp. Soil748]